MRLSAPILFVALAPLVWFNAAASDSVCIAYPDLRTCDNPQAPCPDFPHSLETQATANGSITVAGIGNGAIR